MTEEIADEGEVVDGEETSHVTDEESEAIVRFASEVMAALHLPRYIIAVDTEPAEEGNHASITTIDGRWYAKIQLATDWMEKDDRTKMEVIVHEVCHLLHRGMDTAVDSSFRYMHSYEYAVVSEYYRRETELMVDHLQMFLCDYATVKEAWTKAHKKS